MKLSLLICLSFFISFTAYSQDVLGGKDYIASEDLKQLLNTIKSAPTIHENCIDVDCKQIETYANALYNLREDIIIYLDYLRKSQAEYKKQWHGYIYLDKKNRESLLELENEVALSEACLTIGTVILDVVNVGSAIKNNSVANNIPELIIKFIDRADVLLSALNIVSRYTSENPNSSALDELSGGPTLNTLYISLRAEFDFLKESLLNFEELKVLAKNWKNLSEIQREVKLDNPSITGVFLAIGNLLSLVASHKIDKLKNNIKGFEENIRKDNAFQGEQFDKYHHHFTLIDLLNKIFAETNYTYYNLREANARCFKHLTRERRKAIDTSFGRGLRDYKPHIETASKQIANSWKGIKECPYTAPKYYQFVILDGLGQSYYTDIQILSYYKTYYYGNVKDITRIKLYPSNYEIYLSESENGRQPSLYIQNYNITGKEAINYDSIATITLKPFGRLKLNVVKNTTDLTDFTPKKQPIEFSYRVESNKRLVTEGKVNGSRELDLPADTNLKLIITNTDGKSITKDIKLQPTTTKAVEVVFDELSKPLQFEILDGVGKKITPYFQINKNDGEIVYKMGPSKSAKIALSPGNYDVMINSSINFDMFTTSKATISNLKINGNETEKITLTPYGRVHLDVVDKEGNHINFRYQFNHNGKSIASSFTTQNKLIKTDLQAGIPLRLELNYEYISQVIDVNLPAGKITKLQYVYDDGKFKQDQPEEESQANVTTPEGWIKGTLYNSNDGDCYLHKGQTLEFNIRDRQFYNLKTGKLVNSVVLKAGEKLEVAIPEFEGHFRASPIVDGKKETRISFWYYKHVSKNWWYSAGCPNGTKPISRCNDGKKDINCKTFGD